MPHYFGIVSSNVKGKVRNGILRVKDAYMNDIKTCEEKGHHPHPTEEDEPLWERCSHVKIIDREITVIDYRPSKEVPPPSESDEELIKPSTPTGKSSRPPSDDYYKSFDFGHQQLEESHVKQAPVDEEKLQDAVDPPVADVKSESIGAIVTQDIDARDQEIFRRWKRVYHKLAARKDVAELPEEEKLE